MKLLPQQSYPLCDYASKFAPQIDKAYDAAMSGLPSRLVDIQVCLCHSGGEEIYIFFCICYFVSFFYRVLGGKPSTFEGQIFCFVSVAYFIM